MNIIVKIDNASVNHFKGIISKTIEKAVKDVLQNQNLPNNTTQTDNKLLTRGEVMEMLKVSHTTLYNYQRNGTIPYLKIGNRVYFKKDDILNNVEL